MEPLQHPTSGRTPATDLFHGVDPARPILPTNIVTWSHWRERLHGNDAHHHRYVLILNLEAAGAVIVDHTLHRLRPGECILIFPYQFHHYANLEAETLHWLFITFEAEREDGLLPLRHRVWTVTETQRTHLDEALAAYRNASDEIARNELRLHLALFLCEAVRRQGAAPPPEAGPLSASEETVQAVARYVHDHLDRPFGVSDVAEAVGLSESRLRTVFRAITGTSLGKFVRRTRIRRAQALLLTTEIRIGEIAEQCGFDSLYAFSRSFRDLIGRPPSRYRADARRADENDGPGDNGAESCCP